MTTQQMIDELQEQLECAREENNLPHMEELECGLDDLFNQLEMEGGL